MERKDFFKRNLLVFGIITLFIFIISFSVFYTTENFSSTCGCKLPLWVILVSLSSLGLFVGITTYSIISKNFSKEKEKINDGLNKLLKLIDEDERRIIEILIKNRGEMTQSLISKESGFDKVKISRIISKMIKKEIVEKQKYGMTNKIVLNKDILSIAD
ncbi:MAG: hypothetical protein QXJ28_00545 [Candidatus Pacearchaeota archaeon]